MSVALAPAGSITSGGPFSVYGESDVVYPSDANYTVLAGAASGYDALVLIVTGTISVQRNLVLPHHKGRPWVVKNATTGGFAIQVIGPSGVGIVVANGSSTLLFTDGTDFKSAGGGSVFDPASPGPIGGTLADAGTFTNLTLSAAIGFANSTARFFGNKTVDYSADADKDISAIPNAYTSPVLEITASVGGGLTAARNLTVPFGGPWLVINRTTQTINIGGSSGSRVAVAAGSAIFVGSNTLNFYGPPPGGLILDTTVRTSAFSPVAGFEYQVDPSGASFAASLPSAPNVGDEIRFTLVGNCDGTHTFTINAAGSGIVVRDWIAQTDGASTVFNRVGLSYSFRYVGGTLKSWTVR